MNKNPFCKCDESYDCGWIFISSIGFDMYQVTDCINIGWIQNRVGSRDDFVSKCVGHGLRRPKFCLEYSGSSELGEEKENFDLEIEPNL